MFLFNQKPHTIKFKTNYDEKKVDFVIIYINSTEQIINNTSMSLKDRRLLYSRVIAQLNTIRKKIKFK